MLKNEKITVAFFLPSLEPGGTEKNVVNLVNYIDKEKYGVSLVLGNREGDFIKDIHQNIPIISLNAPGSIRLFFRLIAYFKTQKPDIFVSAFPRINIICIVAKIFTKANTKIMITEHSVFSFLPIIAKTPVRRAFARFFMPTLAKMIYPKADSIVCVSNGIADDLGKIIKSRKTIKVIYNPIVNDEIFTLAKEALNHSWFLDNQIPVIIAVGRLVPCKDYPTLLKAFTLVLLKKPVRLVILGRGSEEGKLKKMAKELGIAKSVEFLGFVENPYKYMSKATVFVLSSLQEGFGNVIIEAMACKVPIVSTDCPTGPGEIIEHMKNGILVAVSDEKSMAIAILKILNNPMLANAFSVEGKKRAEFFSVKKSVQEYEKVFQTL